MHSTKKIIRTISLISAFVLIATASRAVSPPPDGGYPNENTAEGEDALFSLTTGANNAAIGFNALYRNTTGLGNTANGSQALFSNTSGAYNTAIGFNSLYSNTSGGSNTANGYQALRNNTTGGSNTATGESALAFNTTGSFNTANGYEALAANTTGGYNTANGEGALGFNTTGNNNTANGESALANNTTGTSNTATGLAALGKNTTGNSNTSNGSYALVSNRTGSNNTADGYQTLTYSTASDANTANGHRALFRDTTGSQNTAIGSQALLNNRTGNGNIALGVSAGAKLDTGSNNIDIGNAGMAGEADTIRIGAAGTQTASFIAGISGTTVAGGVGVVIDANGHLGTITSAERFKDRIMPMDKASESIMALQPVTFRYKHELDPKGIPQFGLVAEQVEKVNPDLVAHDETGKPYTVRYEAVNAMLLNEFLKEHRKVEEQEATIRQLKKSDTRQEEKIGQQKMAFERTIAQQQTEIRALATQLQKVSNEIELIKPTPRVVVNQ